MPVGAKSFMGSDISKRLPGKGISGNCLCFVIYSLLVRLKSPDMANSDIKKSKSDIP
jgi:hypothetical protein